MDIIISNKIRDYLKAYRKANPAASDTELHDAVSVQIQEEEFYNEEEMEYVSEAIWARIKGK